MIVLAAFVAGAAVAAYKVPLVYMKRGWKRSATQLVGFLTVFIAGSSLGGPDGSTAEFSEYVWGFLIAFAVVTKFVWKTPADTPER